MQTKTIIWVVILFVILIGGGVVVSKNSGSYDGASVSTGMPALDSASTTESVVTRSFTFDEVVAHGTPESCYTAIRGKVYDLSAWIAKHPGGEKAIISICGKDGTIVFVNKHGGKTKQEEELTNFLIGDLKQ